MFPRLGPHIDNGGCRGSFLRLAPLPPWKAVSHHRQSRPKGCSQPILPCLFDASPSVLFVGRPCRWSSCAVVTKPQAPAVEDRPLFEASVRCVSLNATITRRPPKLFFVGRPRLFAVVVKQIQDAAHRIANIAFFNHHAPSSRLSRTRPSARPFFKRPRGLRRTRLRWRLSIQARTVARVHLSGPLGCVENPRGKRPLAHQSDSVSTDMPRARATWCLSKQVIASSSVSSLVVITLFLSSKPRPEKAGALRGASSRHTRRPRDVSERELFERESDPDKRGRTLNKDLIGCGDSTKSIVRSTR